MITDHHEVADGYKAAYDDKARLVRARIDAGLITDVFTDDDFECAVGEDARIQWWYDRLLDHMNDIAESHGHRVVSSTTNLGGAEFVWETVHWLTRTGEVVGRTYGPDGAHDIVLPEDLIHEDHLIELSCQWADAIKQGESFDPHEAFGDLSDS